MNKANDIEMEWEQFISSNKCNDDCTDDDSDDDVSDQSTTYIINSQPNDNTTVPISSDIYISTKTKIAYLNTSIDLKELFWNIPVIQYHLPINGVVKKQMKFNTTDILEFENVQSKLKTYEYIEEYVITHINNPTGRIQFKDVRKISVGLSKKDIMSYRCKKKSAFYNCFVIILRMKFNDIFKEIHVKLFNTGKLEIPGIQNETSFKLILDEIVKVIQPYIQLQVEYKSNINDTVLINSNFNCGYFINREKLYDILQFKYKIQAIYDPCSYPGIQCKFYYDDMSSDIDQTGINNKSNKLTEISFMVFRTGSVLIVGKCDESVINIVYKFLKNMFINEYANICQSGETNRPNIGLNKIKQKKIRHRTIQISE